MKLTEMKRRREEKEERREERRDARKTVQWASGVVLLAGVWLVLAPFVLGYASVEAAAWNDVVVGIVIFIMAMARVGHPLRYEGVSWTNFVLGLWLIAAPFVLSYGDELISPDAGLAYWNDIIVGVIVLAMAAWSAMTTHEAPEPYHYPYAYPAADEPYRRYPEERHNLAGDRHEPAGTRPAAAAPAGYADPAAPGHAYAEPVRSDRVADPVTPPGVDPAADRYGTPPRR